MAAPKNPRGLRSAVEVFESFHDYDVRDVGKFHGTARIPPRAHLAGPCKWVTYRSDKWSKGTFEYIHDITSFPRVKVGLMHTSTGRTIKVPLRIQRAETLTFLGKALGFGYVDDNGDEIEAKVKAGSEWFWSQAGKALVLVEKKRKVHAIIWGGGLNVTKRGIVG